MKKLRKFLATPGVSLCAIALGILLLGTSTVGGAQAAMTVFTHTAYGANMQLQQIKVQLKENGTPVEQKKGGNDPDALTLSGVAIDAKTPIKLGYAYPEALSVSNPGDERNIPEYVRVTIRRYWVDANGNPQPDLNPEYIELRSGSLVLGTDAATKLGNGWVEDTDARTPERIVLYYTEKVEPGSKDLQFADTLTINPAVGTAGTRKADGTVSYDYDGKDFRIEVTVDAIQNSNAEDAAHSAWGRLVEIDEDLGRLTLVYN